MREDWFNCQKCDSLCKKRDNVHFGSGNTKNPPIMFVGDSPITYLDIPNHDKGLSYLGVAAQECYYTFAISCKPPNQRKPRWPEIQNCRSKLIEEILDIKPKIVVCTGNSAVAAIVGYEVKNLKPNVEPPICQFGDLQFNLAYLAPNDKKIWMWIKKLLQK